MTESSKGLLSVLHVVYGFDLSGRSRMIHDLSCRLLAAGHSAAIVSLSQSRGYQQTDVECVTLGKREGLDPSVVWKLAGMLRRRRADVVHTHGRGAVPYVAAAALLAGRRRWIHTVHRADGDRVARAALMGRAMLAGVRVAVAVSEAGRAAFVRENRFPPGRTTVIPNGLDLAAYAALARERLWPGRPVLGTVANLSRDKDPVTLLRGFAEIRKTFPCARLVIVGDGPEAGAARAEAERLGVAPDVEFLGFRGDVPRVLAALDVFVLSTRTEGMGIAILEAMAAGVPVVASAVGGVPEVVEDGVTGRLFAAGDAAALRDAVVEILNDRALREGLVGRALVRVRERFSLDRMAGEYSRLYRGAA